MEGNPEHAGRLLVRGGGRLLGDVALSGAKNSALKLMAATLLTSGPCRIRRTPRISDVDTMTEMLRALGVDVARDGDELFVSAAGHLNDCAPYELVRTMRASIVVMGPLVARLGEAMIAMPGGCNIGPRRIDFHLRGLEKLGAAVEIEHGFIKVRCGQLRGAVVSLDYPSVGATENLVMAATAAEGETVIENAAREPEIADLCAYLRGMGAEIEGEGTSTVRVAGGRPLHGVDHTVVADRIEAGTYLIMGAATAGDVAVHGLDAEHLELFLTKLGDMGVEVAAHDDVIRVRRDGPLAPVDVSTLPHPGFATDLQAQMMVLLLLAEGTSILTENVFENRFVVVDELNRLGAGITTSGHHAVVSGPRGLTGTVVEAPDLRGGAALVTAGLVADGVTEVRGMHHVDRGYEDLVGKLGRLGADVERVADQGER
ncbi:MAG TPA: UDP-N-acetylglucosamine 1-carboxyvinyltransferase [Thermoleophilia bacterium]|nr:UDP-N-acetylglucosamine 1-carboxyvinyltransferase [Thermoleophilia bacterium]HQJ97482.1 UDP-N-acetylglucosamine 1-carboxyvinyltransferase [Thermoleophilia bacterium]